MLAVPVTFPPADRERPQEQALDLPVLLKGCTLILCELDGPKRHLLATETPPGEYAKLAVIWKIDTAPNSGFLRSKRGRYRIGLSWVGRGEPLFLNGQETPLMLQGQEHSPTTPHPSTGVVLVDGSTSGSRGRGDREGREPLIASSRECHQCLQVRHSRS